MNIQDFRALTPDAKLEALFSENVTLNARLSIINTEIEHFRELEDERKRIRKRRRKAERMTIAATATAD